MELLSWSFPPLSAGHFQDSMHPILLKIPFFFIFYNLELMSVALDVVENSVI